MSLSFSNGYNNLKFLHENKKTILSKTINEPENIDCHAILEYNII